MKVQFKSFHDRETATMAGFCEFEEILLNKKMNECYNNLLLLIQRNMMKL